MITFLSMIYNKLCLKNTYRLPRNERTYYFEEKTSKITNSSTFFWLPTSWSCTRIMFQTGGKPSTWFPPVGLVELYFPSNSTFHKVNSITKILINFQIQECLSPGFHENSKISSFFQHFGEEALWLFTKV